MLDLSRYIGDALRQVRIARGLTLRSASRLSEGRFKPSSIAGYERGERAISVQRLCDLTQVYGVDPARLLAGVLREARGESKIEVDLTALERLDMPETAAMRDFAGRVRSGAAGAEVVTLRVGELEVIAQASGHDLQELLDILAAAAQQS